MTFPDHTTPKRAALYLRVSTKNGQTVENQRRQLRKVAKHRGWKIVATYQDEGISGAKGRDKRPGFDKLLKDAARGEFDIMAAWSVDRLGRSLKGLVEFLSEIHALKVDLYLDQQGLDTTTPAGEAMFGMLGVFAQFERAMISERVAAGLARAKAEGTTLGRPPGRSKKRDRLQGRVRRLRKQGKTLQAIVKDVGIAEATVQAYLKD